MYKQQPSSDDEGLFFINLALNTESRYFPSVVFVEIYFVPPISDELLLFVHQRKKNQFQNWEIYNNSKFILPS